MTIEINKKDILLTLSVIVIISLAIYGGYSWGYSSGYSSGVDENPKGDGSSFYAEEFTDYRGNVSGIPINRSWMVYHSTPNCKAIENGVSMNRAYTDSTYRMNYSTFCPKCMDTRLIKLCERFLQQSFE